MVQVKELLKEKGMTAKELAAKLGISEGALSKSLSGNPTLDRIKEIATALGVPVSSLFEQPRAGVITCPNCGARLDITPHVEETDSKP